MFSLRIRSSWSVCAFLALACSAGSEASSSDESAAVGQVSQSMVLSSTANCTVEVTKIDYNQPGDDGNDFIELKVTKKNPGLVTTLADCGIGAIALYDDTSVLCAPYTSTVLATLVIPADGYIEVGQNQSTLNVGVGSSPDGWIHNGRGEIAILTTALTGLGAPLNWFQYGGTAKCNLLAAPVTQVQTEVDAAPNYVNVSCDNTFHLVLATGAVQKTTADCPATGGAGGAGGSGGSGGGLIGIGGLLNLGGTGGLLNVGGLLNLGGTGGLLNIGGLLNFGGTGGLLNIGGLLNLGGSGGLNLGGTGGVHLGGSGGAGNSGGTAAHGGNSGEGGEAGAATAGEAGAEGGGSPVEAGGGGGEINTAGAPSSQGGASPSAGAGHGAAAGSKASAGEAGSAIEVKGDVMVAEGGGCSCSIPKAQNQQRTQALALLAALLGLCIRRRKTRPN